MGEVPVLEVKDITKKFSLGGFIRKKYVTALSDVSLEIPSNKPIILALAGESGSGKTTLSRLILGLIAPSSGAINYEGKNIHKMQRKEKHIFRKKVQAVFQDPFASFNPFYKIDHVLFTPVNKFRLASSKTDAHKIVYEALESVGLNPHEVLGMYPHELSGGMAQRIAIARALIVQPEILVADEPVSMLDMSLRAGILEVLLGLKNRNNMSIIFITHDLSVAYYLSDEIVVLNSGKIVEKGATEEVVHFPAHPYVQQLISSIPSSNPKARWDKKVDLSSPEDFMRSDGKCVFYERCPDRQMKCNEGAPSLINIGKNHGVACNKYA